MTRLSTTRHSACALSFALVVSLAVQGCAALQAGGASAETAAGAAMSAHWVSVADALGTDATASAGDAAVAVLSDDPAALQQTLANACAEGKASGDAAFLRRLIGRLYSSGIDPGTSLEALVRADCAPLSELVRQLVAQGGEPAVAPVVQRALFLAGAGARGLVETAASDGLRADLGGVGREETAASEVLGWVPAGAPSNPGVAAKGYGLYTFVLPGRPTQSPEGTGADRLGELLRVIEIYVLSAGAETGGPSWGRHVFVLPVAPARRGEPLAKQLSAALAADARAALAARLRYLGRAALAERLETSPGPFLISAGQPGLLPVGRADAGARLLVDLSGLGPEYMYAVVDAYDQPIPDDMQGTGQAMDPIRTRLLALFGEHSETAGAARDQMFLLSLQAPAADGG